MRGTRHWLSVAVLSVLVVGTALAQRRDPQVWEFQIWNACGAPLSVDDNKPFAERGAFHTAPDGSAVLHMRWQFQSAEFAAAALEERRHNADGVPLSNDVPRSSGSTDVDGHLVRTKLDDLPLAFSPGVLVRTFALMWVDGAALHGIYGPSAEHVLVLRRSQQPQHDTGATVPRQQPN